MIRIGIYGYGNLARGVEKAVDRFEIEQGQYISKVPLCDKSGTIVITK